MGTARQTKGKTGTRSVVTIVAALSLLGSLGAPSGAYQRPADYDQIDLSSDGVPAEGTSTLPSISADGRYVAFQSDAENLVPGDNNMATDIYLRDVKSGKITLVTQAVDGTPAVEIPNIIEGCVGPTHTSCDPAVSATGRYVAFTSDAINLVPGDTNLVGDVFVYDRKKESIERASLNSAGDEAALPSSMPAISGRGRFISFTSSADNLVDGDENSAPDIFLHDRRGDTTIRVSVASDGSESHGCLIYIEDPLSLAPPVCVPLGGQPGSSISADGRFVAFESYAPDLVPEDTNGVSDVFVHDTRTGKTEVVSVASDGTRAVHVCAGCQAPLSGSSLLGWVGQPVAHSISADGRYVVFASYADNLVPNDTTNPNGNSADVFVHDRASDRTERVSVHTWGGQYKGRGWRPAISPDGHHVAFNAAPFTPLPGEDQGSYGESGRGRSRHYVANRISGGIDRAVDVPTGGPDKQWYSGDGTPDLSAHAHRVVLVQDYFPCDSGFCEGGGSGIWVWNHGLPLGTGGFGPSPPDQEPPDDRICISNVCIPPGSAVSSDDSLRDVDEVVTKQGANLNGASLAHRPQYDDLFAAIELEHMPKVVPGLSPIFYGLRFKVENKSYEVRSTSLLGGTFGLFDCTGSRPACTKVADLRGGYGTMGMRVVFSLPLDEIGLKSSGKLSTVTAFSALGSFASGTTKLLDSVSIK